MQFWGGEQMGIFLETLTKYNPYHDRLGRFTTAANAAFFSLPKNEKLREKLIERERQRTLATYGSLEAEGTTGAEGKAPQSGKGKKTTQQRARINPKAYKEISDAKAEQYGLKISEGWRKSLTPKEQQAIDDYYHMSFDINSMARTGDTYAGKGTPEYKKAVKEEIKVLEKALDRAELPENLVLYRGASFEALGYKLSIFDPKPSLQELKALVGKEFVDKGFMSTSLSEEVGEAFSAGALKLKLYAPKGTKGAYISPKGDPNREREVLLQRNTRFQVLDVKEKKGPGYTYYEVEAVIKQ